MSLVDYPNQFTVFCNNLCTKLMADKRVWQIKWWQINKNSLYTEPAFLSYKASLRQGSPHLSNSVVLYHTSFPLGHFMIDS